MTDAPRPPSLGDVASAAALTLSLVTAWLYGAGWSYAYFYFDQFRIPMILAEMPREHLFVYGGLAVGKNAWWAIAVGAALLALSTVCIWKRAVIGRALLVAAAVAAVLAMFMLAPLAGRHAAAKDAADQRAADYSAYPRVLVAFKTPEGLSEAQQSAAEGCARLVLATKDRLFLMRPRFGMPALELNTIVVPWTDAASVMITGRYTSCP
jgi:hypothetical protein